jgi:hypothetical protein
VWWAGRINNRSPARMHRRRHHPTRAGQRYHSQRMNLPVWCWPSCARRALA